MYMSPPITGAKQGIVRTTIVELAIYEALAFEGTVNCISSWLLSEYQLMHQLLWPMRPPTASVATETLEVVSA